MGGIVAPAMVALCALMLPRHVRQPRGLSPGWSGVAEEAKVRVAASLVRSRRLDVA